MATTRNDYTATSGQADFDLTFPYLQRSDVDVRVNALTVAFSWLSNTRIRLVTPCVGGERVTLRRNTEVNSAKITFASSTILTAGDLNGANSQLLYRLQETEETGGLDPDALAEAVFPLVAEAAANKQDTQFALTPGAALRTVAERFADFPVSIWEYFHLVVDGDWSAAANAANASERTVYFPAFAFTYWMDHEVQDRSTGNFWIGDGVEESRLGMRWDKRDPNMRFMRKIPPTASSNQAGWDNIGVACVQPDQNVRANLKRYPWCLEASHVARLMIGNIRISGGTYGMNLSGNTGGLVGGSWDIGCSDIGVQGGGAVVQKWTANGSTTAFTLTLKSEAQNGVNVFVKPASGSPVLKTQGADYTWVAGVLTFVTAPANTDVVMVAYPPCLDFWKVAVWQNWPFRYEGALLSVFWDGLTSAANLGRIDGLEITAFCNFAGLINIEAEPGSGEGPFGNFGILQCDSTYARVDMSAGRIGVASAYLSGSGTDAKSYAVNVFGNASLSFGSSVITGPLDAPVPFIQNSAYLSFLGGQVQACSITTALARSSGGFFQFNDFSWLSGTNQIRTSAALRVLSGRAHIKGNLFPYVGTGGGPQIRIDLDDAHVITGNSLVGWDYIVPATGAQGQYGPNAVSSLLYGMTVTTGTFNPAPHLDSFFLQASSPITTFGGGKSGRVVFLTFGGDVQVNPGASVKLQGDIYHVYSAGDVTGFVNVNNVWQEFGRSTNRNDLVRSTPAADPLLLYDFDHLKVVEVTGNLAAIGTMSVPRKGTRVLLLFTDVTQVVGNAATIKLAGGANFSTGARYTLDMVSSGTAMVEVGRNANV